MRQTFTSTDWGIAYARWREYQGLGERSSIAAWHKFMDLLGDYDDDDLQRLHFNEEATKLLNTLLSPHYRTLLKAMEARR